MGPGDVEARHRPPSTGRLQYETQQVHVGGATRAILLSLASWLTLSADRFVKANQVRSREVLGRYQRVDTGTIMGL